MALETTFQHAALQLTMLRESLIAFRTTVVEDRPPQGDSVLVDVFGDGVDDLLGWLEEAALSLAEAQQAVSHPVDVHRTRQALCLTHERYHQLSRRFVSDLAYHERMAELSRFGRTHAGPWRAWANDVRHSLDQCWEPLFLVAHALLACWHELTEWAGRLSISVQATNLGQIVTLPTRTSMLLDT